jgi:hypothetical protein
MSRHTWAAALLTAVVAVLVGEVLLFQTLRPTTATHTGEIGLAVLGAGMIVIIAALLVGATRERPRLVIGNPLVEQATIREVSGLTTTTSASATTMTPRQPSGSPERSEDPYFIYLHVWNQPRSGSRMAQGVHVILEYFGSDMTPIYPAISARWSHTPQGVGYETTRRASQEDLLPNGVQHQFDVAVKHVQDDECYAMNDENRYKAPTDMRFRPLGSDVVVKATAQGANAYGVNFFVLLSHGKGRPPEVCLFAKPPGHWRMRRFLRKIRFR